MIYLFAGDDTKNKLEAYEKFSKSVGKETEVFSVNRNEFNKMQIESLYSGFSLFSPKSVMIFSSILDYEETRDFVLEKLELMGKSANSFVFLEGKLGKPVLEAFKKVKSLEENLVELNVFTVTKEKSSKFNNFLVVNAFEKRDKLNVWICFRQAVGKGVGLEETLGILFWKIKDMIIKKDFRKFSSDELENLASRMSYLLPKARKEGRDAEAAFEQFLLEAL